MKLRITKRKSYLRNNRNIYKINNFIDLVLDKNYYVNNLTIFRR